MFREHTIAAANHWRPLAGPLRVLQAHVVGSSRASVACRARVAVDACERIYVAD